MFTRTLLILAVRSVGLRIRVRTIGAIRRKDIVFFALAGTFKHMLFNESARKIDANAIVAHCLCTG